MFARFLAFQILLVVARSALGQAEILEVWGGEHHAHMGTAVAAAGDVDRDGFGDVVVGAPDQDVAGAVDAGLVEVWSGRTNQLVFSVPGTGANDRLGRAVAGVGDVDGDGYDDVATGYCEDASPGNGGVSLYSGQTGGLLGSMTGTDGFGRVLAAIGDVDGDGRPDLAAGEPLFGGGAGRVRVLRFDGAGLVDLASRTWVDPVAGAGLGGGLAGIGDVTGDGVPDIAAGAPDAAAGAGHVRVLSGLGATDPGGFLVRTDVQTLVAAASGFGFSVAPMGDVDADGVPDYAAGAPGTAANDGAAEIISGASGAKIRVVAGDAAAAERLGAAVARAPDMDADGRADLAAGCPDWFTQRGRVQIFSSASGVVLGGSTGINTSAFVGIALADAGDCDGDGVSDLVFGEPGRQDLRFANFYVGAGRAQVLTFRGTAGATNAGQGGAIVAGVGDVDGDDVPDWALGSPDGGAGVVTVFSGLTAATIHSFAGTQTGERFGAAVAGVGDVDGDGRPDVAVGAPNWDAQGSVFAWGRMEVFSGATGATLLSRNSSTFSNRLGFSLAAAGDVNGDGTPDILVGLPGYKPGNMTGAGRIEVISGQTGSVLLAVDGGASFDEFGYDVDGAGDVNGDGVPDIVVGVRGYNSAIPGSGAVELLSGANGNLIFRHTGIFTAEELGYTVAGVGDVDADGVPDFAAGAPEYRAPVPANPQDRGRIDVLSGATGQIIFSRFGDDGDGHLGRSLAGVGDLDLDGHADVAAGAPEYRIVPPGRLGRMTVYSGAGGAALIRLTGRPGLWDVGLSVAATGDLDGDGFGELVVGAMDDVGAAASGTAVIVAGGGYAGAVRYGVGTPGCNGPMSLQTSGPPTIGSASFALTVSNGPAVASGLVFIALPLAKLDPAVDLFGIGLDFHVDPGATPFTSTIPFGTDVTGYARLMTPLAFDPVLIGLGIVMQGFLYWGPACPLPFGWSSTNGLEVVFQG